MQVALPSQVIFRQFSLHENGWSDHYGAIQTAAAYAGIACPPRYALRGVWQHGVFGPWQNLSPEAIVYSTPRARELPVWVARPDQAEYLEANGFTQVRVAGMPICYTAETGLARLPGTLLVVPTHTLSGDTFPDRAAFEQYADEIKAAAGRFQKVVICVHPNCRKNGLWVKEFTERGFDIVYGAQTSDANALLRMRMLFEQFEFVTTNGWGSHVAYALAFGAKVSIHGTQPQRTEADYLRDECWAANPAALHAMLSGETQRSERAYLQAFHQPPGRGVADVAQGRWLIGADHRLAPAAMQEALPRLAEPRNEGDALADKRRELCRQTRAEAARLVTAHRTPEAVQVLLRFVQLAADTKHPVFILETLQEISRDLQPLDPARAGRLLEQARRLAARIEIITQSAA